MGVQGWFARILREVPRSPLRKQGILLAFVTLLSAIGCVSEVDRIVVPMATLVPDAEGWELPALEGQRIIEGHEVVLSRREFRWLLLPLADTQDFRVLSVAIPELRDSRDLEVGQGPIRLAYSRGSSAIPSSGCIAYATSGSVEIRKLSDGAFRVRISAKTGSDAKGAHKRDCMDLTLEDEGVYRIRPIGNLPAWLGGPFEHPYDASFR